MVGRTNDGAPDPVSAYLGSLGFPLEVACFGASAYVIGHRVRLAACEVVYRLEDDQLIICDFVAPTDEGQRGKAVLAFVRLIHQIERNVPRVGLVRGMFVKTLSNPALNALRERLASALVAQGADWREIDGEPWLVYRTRAAGP